MPIIDDNLTVVGKIITTGGQSSALRIITSGTTVNLTSADNIVEINKTVSSPTSVVLPAISGLTSGSEFIVIDGKGDISGNNLTFTVDGGGNINGSSSLIVSNNRQETKFIFDGTQYLATSIPSFIQFTSVEQDLGNLTWTATTAPGGTVTKKYKWTRNGNDVTVHFKITASVAGLLATAVEFDLPSDMPIPNTFSSQPNNFIVSLGSGLLSAADNPVIGVLDITKLFRNGTGGYAIRTQTVNGLAATRCWGSISYIA